MKKIVSFFAAALLGISVIISIPVFTSAETTNSEYSYTIQDLRNLQDFLVTRPTEENLTGKPYDLNGDGVWNVFDLCLMKNTVLNRQEDTSDILVAYFSQTGNTEKIANHIIDITNADSYVIEAAIPYTDEDIQYTNASCRANQEQNDKSARPEIASPIESIEAYDIIFLGYPIWWGEEPRIIDTFLESYDFSDKTVIPFCTSGSSGIGTSERNIGNLVAIGSQFGGRRFSANSDRETVDEWLKSLPLSEKKEETKLKIEVNGYTMTATLADNPSAQALAELIKNEPMILELNEYGSFEKVGALPQSLPKDDERITTESGDIMLYQGNQMTIFYDSNTWSYTKLGKIDNITQAELKKILGKGNVTVTLSLSEGL